MSVNFNSDNRSAGHQISGGDGIVFTVDVELMLAGASGGIWDGVQTTGFAVLGSLFALVLINILLLGAWSHAT